MFRSAYISRSPLQLAAIHTRQRLDVTAVLSMGAIVLSGSLATLSVLFPSLEPWLFRLTYGLAVLYLAVPSMRLAFFAALALSWTVQREPAPSDLLFAGATAWALLGGRLRIGRDVVGLALFAFVAINAAQIVLAEDLWRAAFFAGVSAYLVILVFTTRAAVDNWNDIAHFERFYLAAGVLTALILAISAFGVKFGLQINEALVYGGSRPRGYFKDPNVAGPFVVSAVTLLMSRLLFQKQRRTVRTAAMLAIMLLAIIVTFSRGALLNAVTAVVAAAPFVIRFRGSRRRLATLLLAAIFVGTPAIWYLWQSFGQAARFTLAASYDVGGRFAAWMSGILMAIDRPFGIGPGQFEIVSPEYQGDLPFVTIVTPSAHSTYVRILAENGLVGLLFFLTGVFGVFGRSLGLAAKLPASHPLKPIAVWIVSSLAGILIESFVIDTMHWRHFWLLVGLALVLPKLAARTQATC